LPEAPTATHAEQQAHRTYLTLQQALHALPADHPATSGVAGLTILAVRHWQALRQAAAVAPPVPGAGLGMAGVGQRPATLRAVA
jgi:hypothetical protein